MEPAEPMAPGSGEELTRAWREWGRWLATVGAIAFALTALILLLDNLHVFVKPPDLPDATRLPDRLIAICSATPLGLFRSTSISRILDPVRVTI